jgi:transcription elongation factor GreA
MSQQIISQDGYVKLKEELEYLQTVKRMEIADRIEKAKELGDLSENAEYAAAKDAQAFNQGRIVELSNALKNLVIVENASKDTIGMGSKITIEGDGKIKEYSIVSFNEAEPSEGKISNESPLGQAFLGKKKGDQVKVKTPKGEMEYKIIKIQQ